MKSECAVRAAERPTTGPLSAVMRSLGWVEKAWVVCWKVGEVVRRVHRGRLRGFELGLDD